ncbi:tryptophan synthase subunit alpha [Streptomyces sp. NPDC058595]|uniref:tryptophan synthase subunit alpha n=1 Tax=Streptomyces sp. NPDC058595 TaxID=3346550 RepID=UPI00365F8DA5
MTASLAVDGPATRLRAAFERTRRDERGALVGCLPAGFPSVEQSVEALRVLGRHVDVLEVGLPHNNRDLEGSAAYGAWDGTVASGFTVADVLDVVRQVAATVNVPVMLMSYWEPIARIGTEPFAAALASAGGAGLVLPGLHPRGPAAARWLAAAEGRWLATAFTAAPGARRDAAETSTGWVGLSALTHRPADQHLRPVSDKQHLPTQRAAPDGDLLDLANLRGRARMLGHMTTTPICASGGIYSPAMAEAIAPGVDAIAVRSAFVRALQRARTFDEGLAALDERAARYAVAVRRGGRTMHAGPDCDDDRCRTSCAA